MKQKLGLICSLHIAARLSFPLRDSGSRPVGSISYISPNPPHSGIRQMSHLSILWVVLGLCSALFHSSHSFITTHTRKKTKTIPLSLKNPCCGFACSISKSAGVPSWMAANNTFSCKKKCQSVTFVVVNTGSGSCYLVLAFFLGCWLTGLPTVPFFTEPFLARSLCFSRKPQDVRCSANAPINLNFMIINSEFMFLCLEKVAEYV